MKECDNSKIHGIHYVRDLVQCVFFAVHSSASRRRDSVPVTVIFGTPCLGTAFWCVLYKLWCS